MNIYFDIETAPLPPKDALLVAPAFEPDARLKDTAKIAADIEAKEAKWMDRAALDPLTGQVAVFAWCNEQKPEPQERNMLKQDEAEIIKFAMDGLNANLMAGGKVVGFNIRGFDLPFMLRRAIILGVPIPPNLRYQVLQRFSEGIVDLMQVWLFGDRDFKGQSLKNIALRCGIGEKGDEGKVFSDILQQDPDAAIEYAKQDVRITMALARRMGF